MTGGGGYHGPYIAAAVLHGCVGKAKEVIGDSQDEIWH